MTSLRHLMQPVIMGSTPQLHQSLVSYWQLNEASGVRYDAHANRHLADNNTVTSATGKVGKAANFVAANSEFLSLASASALDIVGDTSWLFWLNLNDTATRSLLSKEDSASNRQWRIDHFSSLRITVFDADNNVIGQAASGALSTSTWYFAHIYYSSTDDEVGVSINNGAATTGAVTGTPGTGSSVFRIGSRQTVGSDFFDGLIDEVAQYNRLMTSAEVTWFYNAGNGRAYGDLKGY